ncbi:MAG: DUF4439 domain-containing protein [Mycobacteriaceae bacterium]
MNPEEQDALTEALAAEHAAVYAYGVVAARALPGRTGAVRAATDVHEQRRDALVAALTAAGASAPVAAPGYLLPVVVTNGEQAIALALAVEEGVALAWHSVLERSEPGTAPATPLPTRTTTPTSAPAPASNPSSTPAPASSDLVTAPSAPGGTYAVRPTALAALTDCAVRATGWRRVLGTSPATTAFPGTGVRG